MTKLAQGLNTAAQDSDPGPLSRAPEPLRSDSSGSYGEANPGKPQICKSCHSHPGCQHNVARLMDDHYGNGNLAN